MSQTFKNLIIAFLISIFFQSKVCFSDSMSSPLQDDIIVQKKEEREISFLKIPIIWSIQIYQRFISPINGRWCQMYPSCSRYGAIALKKHGLIKGSLIATDRIHRCGHDLSQYKRVIIDNKILYIDHIP